jgi:hypothetical protein
MNSKRPTGFLLTLLLAIAGCDNNKNDAAFRTELQSINLTRGEITLCGSEDGQFGKVAFGLSCQEKVRADFNLATALLHSFEYTEAEKVFAKIIDEDPECLMAYWGVAMSNFHPLWAPPTKEELEKGSKTITLARKIDSSSDKESAYLEAVAVMYDDWNRLDHKARMLKFEKAAEEIYARYPDDKEAAIFYALALRAASDPTDKSFTKQKKAGAILNALFPKEPNHPGVAHYLIHTYDYPELAELALPAARKYASIAATSAHALHMPSHIFTRLGLWEEAAASNINSISAAQCYAEKSGMKGHWDEELHGIDYLVYAYLQQGKDELAKAQLDYLSTIEVVYPLSNKNAYTFASVPTRYALERKDWQAASRLKFHPANFPWDKFLWERSLVSFGKVLGNLHTSNRKEAEQAMAELKDSHAGLLEQRRTYEANHVHIQLKAAEAWLNFSSGNRKDAVRLMTEAADMEDATDKHPVTPGEVVPARELLADLLMEMGEFGKALETYEADLARHPGRFNGIYGAALAAQKSGNKEKAILYFRQLKTVAGQADTKRPELNIAETFLKNI